MDDERWVLEVRAEVIRGRWMVKCPWCPEVQPVNSPVNPGSFMCMSYPSMGQLLVRFPRRWDAGEKVLGKRPDITTRNWLMSETVEDLMAENLEHGIGA